MNIEHNAALQDLASLLARGIMRLRQSGASSDRLRRQDLDKALNSAAQDLAKPAKTRLSVHKGLRPES
jgi:hypothetical protein